MPITVTPQQYADRWSQGLSGAAQKITDGVNAVTTAPSQKAIAAQQKMVTNWNASITGGKWKTNLGKVTLAQWQSDMITKGVPRISSGALAANSKMQAFASQLIPFEQQLQNTINAMPKLTLQDSIARATAWINGMSKFVMK
jgi:hypothetical protein